MTIRNKYGRRKYAAKNEQTVQNGPDKKSVQIVASLSEPSSSSPEPAPLPGASPCQFIDNPVPHLIILQPPLRSNADVERSGAIEPLNSNMRRQQFEEVRNRSHVLFHC